MARMIYCGDTGCSCFSTGDWTEGFPRPEPQVESAGEQVVGVCMLGRKPLSNGTNGFSDVLCQSLHAAIETTIAVAARQDMSFITTSSLSITR